MPGPVRRLPFCNFHDTVLTVLCQAKPGRFLPVLHKISGVQQQGFNKATEAQAETQRSNVIGGGNGVFGQRLPAAQDGHGAQLLAGGHRRLDAFRQGKLYFQLRVVPLGCQEAAGGRCS